MLTRLLLALLTLAAVGGGAWWMWMPEHGALGATTVAADSRAEDEADDDADEVTVALDQLPDGVLAAAQTALPEVAFQTASTELEDGERRYELHGQGADGHVEIELGSDGTVLEVEHDDDD